MSDSARTRKNLWMFPLGTVGRDMIYTLFTNFILTYILFTRSLTAAQLSAVTAIMVAARAPVCGSLPALRAIALLPAVPSPDGCPGGWAAGMPSAAGDRLLALDPRGGGAASRGRSARGGPPVFLRGGIFRGKSGAAAGRSGSVSIT